MAAAADADGSSQNSSLCKLPDYCFIYTAELHATYLTIKFICQSKKQSFRVLSDSLYVVMSNKNQKCDQPFLMNIFSLYSTLICDNKDTVFAWVPRHVGIQGNCVVDLAAKHALKMPTKKRLVVHYSDLKVLTNMYVKEALANRVGKISREQIIQDSTQIE